MTEYVGNGGVGIFYQTGGTNTAANVSVNGGYFLLSGGQLQGSGGGTIGVVNGGFQSPGTLDLSQFVTVSAGTGALLDLSGNVLNTVGASVSVGPDSLLIVPQGFDPITSYASYSNQGLLHTLGSTLSVSASTGFGGWGTIADPVNCQGTILATPGGWINLNNGLSLADPGQVNLGTGTVIVNDTNFSSMTGGALTASLMVVGSNGTGSFPQSGGASALSSLYLGNNGGDSGTYLLSGTSQLSVGYEIVGLAGSGTFTQSGGTHAVGTLYLAEQFGSAGTYNLGGGLLSLSALYPYSGGAAAFNFGGGTLQAAAPLTIYMPITLSAAWTNGVFDTNGNASTLYGPLSGPGGLIVAGSGTLTLAVSNNYTGTTLVCNGTLMLGDSNALSGSTFDMSGTGALVFNGGIGGFAFGGLQGSGSLLLTDNGITDIALTVGLNNADTTFSGSLSDSNSGGSLTLVGTGTLTLTGTNTYGGGTVVEGGTLVLTNNEALPDGSNVAIGDPALLTMFGDVVSSARSTGFSRNASDDPAEAGTTMRRAGTFRRGLACRRRVGLPSAACAAPPPTVRSAELASPTICRWASTFGGTRCAWPTLHPGTQFNRRSATSTMAPSKEVQSCPGGNPRISRFRRRASCLPHAPCLCRPSTPPTGRWSGTTSSTRTGRPTRPIGATRRFRPQQRGCNTTSRKTPPAAGAC